MRLLVGDYWPLSTSSAGNAGGTTAVFAALTGVDESEIVNRYLLLTSGTNSGEWRFSQIFTPSSGTTTVPRAYTGQVASAVTAELLKFRPDLYTQACNRAILEVFPHISRPILGVLLPQTEREVYAVPRNMRQVDRLLLGGTQLVKDLFDRADSTTTPGNSWVETVGNWGVISERGYAESDADANHMTRDPDVRDGYIQSLVRGTLNSATVYRSPALTFRIAEDRNGDIDTNNYLLVRLLNGVVDLRKVDGGTESSLVTATQTTADGTDYEIKVLFNGARIRVAVDDVLLISYELVGLNLKYREYPRVGIRWDKAGSPATAARVDDYHCYNLLGLRDYGDWEQHADTITLRAGAVMAVRPTSGHLLLVEGRQRLTLLTDDTTFETLDTDTTERLEIETGDPAFPLLLNYAAYCLYEQASQPANGYQQEDRAEFAEEAKRALARYFNLLQEHTTPEPKKRRQIIYG